MSEAAGGQGGAGVAEATPASVGSEVSSESLVTPAIQAKFDEVFGGKEADTDREAAAGPTGTKGGKGKKAAPANRTGRQKQAYFNNDDFDGTGDGDEGDAGNKPPEAPNPQQAPPRRSRVQGPSAQPAGQQATQEAAPASTLSPVLRQAALRARWDADVVESFYQENPQLAESTFQQLHRSQNELSARYAAMADGQPQPRNPAAPPPAIQQRQQQQPVQGVPGDVGQLLAQYYPDLPQLQNKWGDALPELIGPLVQPLMQMSGELREAMTFIQGMQRQTMAAEATQWLQGIEKDFGDVYGPAKGQLSQEQRASRRELTIQADRIRTGASAQGVQMTVSEALERAHLMLAAPHVAEVQRKQITARIRQRSGSITARPTQRNAPARQTSMGGGGEKSIEAAMAAYSQKASELGILDD